MKKIKDKELKEGLEIIFKSISEKSEKEDKESPIFDFLSKQLEYLKDADTFNSMAIYPIKRIIGTFVSTQFKKDNHLAEKIYTNYDFFEDNLSNLCSQMYGSACSVDKARFLLRQAIKWKEIGNLPVFNWDSEYTFHYPETGTPEQWNLLKD